MQKTRNTLLSIVAAVAGTKAGQMISGLEFEDLLRPLGLTRRVSWLEKLAYLGAGIAVGGVAALLLAPASGQQTRARLAKKAGELGDVAQKQVREIGEHIREEVEAVREHADNGHTSAYAR